MDNNAKKIIVGLAVTGALTLASINPTAINAHQAKSLKGAGCADSYASCPAGGGTSNTMFWCRWRWQLPYYYLLLVTRLGV